MAELYSKLPEDKVVADRLEVWLKKVEKIAPYHTSVFMLKEKVLKARGEDNPAVIEELLTQQMVSE